MMRTAQLTSWIRLKHQGQLVRRTNAPYFDHLIAVAEMAAPATPFGYEIGLCHDLFEKTATRQNEFHKALLDYSYTPDETGEIISQVVELTDVFTKASYPLLSKAVRKSKEEKRLATISCGAQTVKYADLIYNIQWMMKYDLKHAENYLKRKQHLLRLMAAGNPGLHNEANELISHSLLIFEVRD
jgi:(p)ppGpp synthase/HD superfamily hydrolase